MNCKIILSILGILFSVFPLYGQPVKSNPEKEKASISFRVSTGISLSEKRFDELMALFNKYKGVTDEVTLFTSETHPPLPLDVFKERMDIFKKRMQTARKSGYRAGINILSTIGHHNENLENSLHGDYTNMTDIDENVCKGSYCPNDKKFQEYIRELYKSMALADPDYIWIDDDIRLAGHSPLYLTCFCDNCLSIFEEESGKKYSRESFKIAANEGSAADKLQLRNEWLKHNRNTITNLFELIEKTVHDLRPGMPLGFMTGDRFYEGYDFDNWAKVLAGKNNLPVVWRPGGGFYQDNVPGDLAGKSHDIGRQISVLPKDVVSIQSEIENYTYQRLKKSANVTGLEAASHIAAGCTGAAFNVLTFYDEPLTEFEPLIARLHELRPFYDKMVSQMGRSSISGISSFWNKNSFSSANLKEGSWFNAGVSLASYELDELGLPTSYNASTASVIKLKKDNINGLSDKEIERLLSKGVYMDAEALIQLNERGFKELTGFEITGAEKMDRIEKLTAHPLNGNFSGRERDTRMAIYKSEAYTLKKTNPRAESLSGLIDYADKPAGETTMGIFENRLGGRICVAGYVPWGNVHTLSKSSQMKSVFRWLSKDDLLGYVDSYHKINLWVREAQKDKTVLAFTNSSFDPAKNVVLKLKTASKAIKVYDMGVKETIVKSSGTDGPYQKFVIPQVDAWQMRLVVAE
jgi:hypothetical protein